MKKFLPVSGRNQDWLLGFFCHLIHTEGTGMLNIRSSVLPTFIEYRGVLVSTQVDTENESKQASKCHEKA